LGCSGGAVCKLAWASNPPTGAPNYPRGRYPGVPGGPWPTPPLPYPSAETVATLTDPLFPPNPIAYESDWITPTGQTEAYWVSLTANYYDTSQSNPPSPPTWVPPPCAGICTFQ